MKKIISLILAVIMLCSVFSGLNITANAATDFITSDDGNYIYYLLDDNTICLYGFSEDYSGDTTILEIPSTIDGYSVVFIDDYCFNFEICEKVIIPDTVVTIGTGAFASCNKLKEVVIPASVKYIYDNAFFNCTNLTKMVIPGDLALVGEHALGYYQSFDDSGNLDFTAVDGFTVYGNSGKLAYYESKYGVNYEEIAYVVNVDSLPEKTEYIVGDEPDWTGLEISAGLNYEDPVSVTDYEISGFDSSTSGTKTITVTQGESSANFEITVIPTEINIDKDSETIYVTGTSKLTATITNGKGETTFTSSDPEVATVDNEGNIIAVKEGTTEIIVANNGTEKVFPVTVCNPYLDIPQKNMITNQTHQLTITGQIGEATFESSNEKVATVDENGLITAGREGDATITVTVNGVTLTCVIDVWETVVKADPLKPTLYVTDTTKLITEVVYGIGETTFSSSAPEIASVDAEGNITTHSAGVAKITITNNGEFATVNITVKNPALNITSATLAVDKKLTLKITGQIGTATFKTSNKKLATVNAKGVVTAKKEGTVTITVLTNGVTLNCKITVKGNPKISKKKATLEMGDTLNLKVTGTGQKAKWTTSNKKVAIVNKKGKVTAKKAGSATITAKVGSKKLTCKIKVKVPAPKISVFISGEPAFTQAIALSIENMGNLKLTVKNSGILVNNGVDTYQNLYLTDSNGVKANKVDIKAGEEKSVCVVFKDRGHYYDEDTYVWFNFEYAGVLYQAQVRYSSVFGLNKCYKIVKL